MKRIPLIVSTALITATFAAAVSAQTATFTYNDGTGTPNSGSYAPGSSITFSITLNFVPGGNVSDAAGLSYWFEQQNPNSPFNFAITNRNAAGSQFSDLQTPGISYPQNMTPQNTSDLGAFVVGSGLGTGNYFVASLTISISPTALPGSYLIENTTTGGKTSVVTDDLGHLVAIPQATYNITVIPEPSSVALLVTGICLSGIGLRRRRMVGRD